MRVYLTNLAHDTLCARQFIPLGIGYIDSLNAQQISEGVDLTMEATTKSQIQATFDDHREKLSLFSLSQMMQMFLGRFYFEPITEIDPSHISKASIQSSETVGASAS